MNLDLVDDLMKSVVKLRGKKFRYWVLRFLVACKKKNKSQAGCILGEIKRDFHMFATPQICQDLDAKYKMLR